MTDAKKATAKKGRPSKPVVEGEEKKVIDNSPEAKKDRFKKIAARRTKNIIKTLKNLGNCSNTNVYSFTPEQVTYIFKMIKDATTACESKFEAKAKESKDIEVNL